MYLRPKLHVHLGIIGYISWEKSSNLQFFFMKVLKLQLLNWGIKNWS